VPWTSPAQGAAKACCSAQNSRPNGAFRKRCAAYPGRAWRDLEVEIVHADHSLERPISTLMTSDGIRVTPETEFEEAIRLMTDHRVSAPGRVANSVRCIDVPRVARVPFPIEAASSALRGLGLPGPTTTLPRPLFVPGGAARGCGAVDPTARSRPSRPAVARAGGITPSAARARLDGRKAREAAVEMAHKTFSSRFTRWKRFSVYASRS
jgi:hypothetical protein